MQADTIIRYLNEKQIKTSYGNEFNKNSIHRILTNKRYIGTYTYRDNEIPNGLPRIVSDDLFHEVQEMIARKKKAPARAKADTGYTLTTKLFCGQCKAVLRGIIGTSQTGGKYYYYQCVTNRREKTCDTKLVPKEYLENEVITRTREMLTPENIDKIAAEVVALCERDTTTTTTSGLKSF